MDIKFEKTKCYILAWCIEDWTPLFFIVGFVEKFYVYEDPNLVKSISLKIIKNLLEEKLVTAGDLLEGNNFVPWQMSIDEIIAKIKFEWDNLGRELYPHEIVWLEVTEKGKNEFEYLVSLPELKEEPNYYFRICDGGQKGAEELLNQIAKDAQLIKNDTLRKIKVYKLLDNTQFCYREHSKFGMRINTIDFKFPDIKKYIQFKFTETL